MEKELIDINLKIIDRQNELIEIQNLIILIYEKENQKRKERIRRLFNS